MPVGATTSSPHLEVVLKMNFFDWSSRGEQNGEDHGRFYD